MNKFYNPSVRVTLSEIKNEEKKTNFLKSFMQIIFVLSFLLLVFLAFAKAHGV
jgi:hypothetical protein